MRCVIISHGVIQDYKFHNDIIDDRDMVICADAGCIHAYRMGVTPQLIVGDLDSVDPAVEQYFRQLKVPFKIFPKEKDKTDTELAVDIALEQKADEILLMGVLGSRMDHTLANISLLKTIALGGARGRIVNEYNEIYITREKLTVSGKKGEYLSLMPIDQRVMVRELTGLKFPLHDRELNYGSSLCISNEFTDSQAKVWVEGGWVLVIKARD